MAKTRRQHREAMKQTRLFLLWFAAVSHAQDGKLGPLIKVLRTDFGTSRGLHKVEQWGRARLATLLERRNLRKKQGGQPTPLFNLSEGDRMELAAKLARALQAGRVNLTQLRKEPTPEMIKRLPKTREEVERWRRGHAQEPNTALGTIDGKLKDAHPPKLRRTEAIDVAARFFDVSDQKLHNFMAGKSGYDRGR